METSITRINQPSAIPAIVDILGKQRELTQELIIDLQVIRGIVGLLEDLSTIINNNEVYNLDQTQLKRLKILQIDLKGWTDEDFE